MERHGPNKFSSERGPSAFNLLLSAIANPFNFILLALSIVSIATGDNATFAVLVIMVILSTGLRSVCLLIRLVCEETRLMDE